MPPPPPAIGSGLPSFNNLQNNGPPSLTQGIPDPGAIARQKDVYLKMLDDQMKQGINVLDQQVKYQRDYLTVQCEQQKKQFLLQLDQQMKAQEMVLTQQYNEQLMQLQMQAGTQKAALEQQAMQLSMEYEQRKAEEHMYRQQYEIQQQQTEMAVKMAQDYQRMAPQGPPGQHQRGYESPMPSYVPAPIGGGSASYVPPPMMAQSTGSYVPHVVTAAPCQHAPQGQWLGHAGHPVVAVGQPMVMQPWPGSMAPGVTSHQLPYQPAPPSALVR